MGIKFASIKASQAVVHNIGVDYTKKSYCKVGIFIVISPSDDDEDCVGTL